MFEELKKIFIGEPQKTYNAGFQGWLLTKSDRINQRIEKFAQTVKKQNTTIDVKDFMKFVKSVQILIAQELTYQKYEEEKKNLSQVAKHR